MEGIKRPYFWAVLFCGVIAFIFHMIGFVAPGWIIVSIKPQPIDSVIRRDGQIGEDVNFEVDDSQGKAAPRPGSRAGPHRGPGPYPGPWHHRGPHQPGMGPMRESMGPNSAGMGPQSMGPHGQGMAPNAEGMGQFGPGFGPDGQHMGPNGQRMGPNGQGMGPNGHGMGPNWQAMRPQQGETESRDRDRRHAIADSTRSDFSHMGKNFDRDDKWPMGSMHGMDSTPDLGEMDDFMEKRMNQDLDSFTDSMGLWSDMMMSEQNASEHCLETMATITSLAAGSRISMRIGLWFSHLCVTHENDIIRENKHGEPRMHNRRCRCRKMPSDCFFEPYDMFGLSSYEQMGSYSYEDNRSAYFGEKLKEHRIEGAMSVVMCLVGLILGAIAFKSSVAKKWFAVFGMTATLLSELLITLPVIHHVRLYMRMNTNDLLSTHVPYSVICSTIGGLLCVTTMLIIAIGLYRKNPERRNWYKFNNPITDPTVEKNRPRLVFMTEPFPEKPPMYDVSDFGNLEPSEEYKETLPPWLSKNAPSEVSDQNTRIKKIAN